MGVYVPGGTAVLPSTALMLSVVSLSFSLQKLLLVMYHPLIFIMVLNYQVIKI